MKRADAPTVFYFLPFSMLLNRIALTVIMKMKTKEKESAIDIVAVSDYIRKKCKKKKKRMEKDNYVQTTFFYFVYSLKMID
jgi:hypothetical protein